MLLTLKQLAAPAGRGVLTAKPWAKQPAVTAGFVSAHPSGDTCSGPARPSPDLPAGCRAGVAPVPRPETTTRCSPKGTAGAPGLVEQTLRPRREHPAAAAAAAGNAAHALPPLRPPGARPAAPPASGSRHVPHHARRPPANGLWWSVRRWAGPSALGPRIRGGFTHFAGLRTPRLRPLGTPGPWSPGPGTASDGRPAPTLPAASPPLPQF